MSISQFHLSKRMTIIALLVAALLSGVVGMGLYQASAAGNGAACVSGGNVQFSSAQAGATVGVRVTDANHNVIFQQTATVDANGRASISLPASALAAGNTVRVFVSQNGQTLTVANGPSNMFSGSGAFACGTTSSSGGGNGAGQANFHDGRLNNTLRDVAAPFAVYCSTGHTGGIDIYAVQPGTESGVLAFSTTPREMARGLFLIGTRSNTGAANNQNNAGVTNTQSNTGTTNNQNNAGVTNTQSNTGTTNNQNNSGTANNQNNAVTNNQNNTLLGTRIISEFMIASADGVQLFAGPGNSFFAIAPELNNTASSTASTSTPASAVSILPTSTAAISSPLRRTSTITSTTTASTAITTARPRPVVQ